MIPGLGRSPGGGNSNPLKYSCPGNHIDKGAGRLQSVMCHAKSLQLCLAHCSPMDCNPSAPLSMEFSRQEYWNGLPFPPPDDLPKPRIEPMSLDSPALADRFFTTEPPGKISFKYSPENVSKVKLMTQLSK